MIHFRHRSSLHYILFNGRDRLRASGGEVFAVKLDFSLLIQSGPVIGKHRGRTRRDNVNGNGIVSATFRASGEQRDEIVVERVY